MTAGINRLEVGGDQRFDLDSPLRGPLAKSAARAFWKDKQGIIGLRAKFGDGTIVALADTYPLSNLGISDADNGLLLANLARELSDRYPGQIAFDEYHLGFAERDWSSVAIAKLMLAGDWRWAVAQAALVGVLALYAAGRAIRQPARRDAASRAGSTASSPKRPAGCSTRPAPSRWPPRRSFATTATGSAGWCISNRTPTTSGSARRSASARAGRSPPSWQQAQGAIAGRAGRQKLLAISQQLHRVVEALDHGT